MPRLDVFGNISKGCDMERKVPRFYREHYCEKCTSAYPEECAKSCLYDPNLGRPVTIPPMGPEMTHYQGDQPTEPYPGAFEPPLKEQIFADDLNRVKRIAEESEKRLKPSVINRAVKNSPPPLDDVGGLEDEMFDPLDPDLAAIKALAFETTPHYVDDAVSLLNKAAAIVAGKRMEQHGPKERNHDNIAILWRAYMQLKEINESGTFGISAWDVASMMELLKLARRFAGAGRTNPDNYIDGAGYCGVAGEIALNAGEVK